MTPEPLDHTNPIPTIDDNGQPIEFWPWWPEEEVEKWNTLLRTQLSE